VVATTSRRHSHTVTSAHHTFWRQSIRYCTRSWWSIPRSSTISFAILSRLAASNSYIVQPMTKPLHTHESPPEHESEALCRRNGTACSLRGSVESTNCSDSTGTLCATRVVALRTTSCGSLLVAHILYFLDFVYRHARCHRVPSVRSTRLR